MFSILLTADDVQASEKYVTVTAERLSIYENQNGQLVEMGHLLKGMEYGVIAESGNWLEIQYGDRRAYILKAATTSSDGKSIIKKSGNKKEVGAIEVTEDTTIYDNATGALIPFGVMKKGVSYPVINDLGNWLEVHVAGRIGYIHSSTTKKIFSPADRYFKVVRDNVPIYENRNGTLIEVGRVVKGMDYERVKDIGNWHQIDFGGRTAFVLKQATEPSAGKAVTWQGNVAGKYSLQAKEDATIYDNSTGKLVPFATVKKGISLNVTNMSGNWIETIVGNRKGYIYIGSVTFLPTDVVNPKTVYTYTQMQRDLTILEKMYGDFLEVHTIGQSVDGRHLYAVKLGKGKKEIFINGSHHAREYISTNLVMEKIDQYAYSYARGTKIGAYHTRTVLDDTAIWFVPMVNPDGVSLVQLGHKSAKRPQDVLKMNGGSTNFASWKANVRGVDLNKQYPANWNNLCCNARYPGPENYKGTKALSEPEAKALYDFTLKHNFRAAISYHSSGEILYWYFKQQGSQLQRDEKLARKISNTTGYSMVPKSASGTGGGYSDWFISTQKMPAFTPELSPYAGRQPVPLKNFDRIWKQNVTIGLMVASEMK
ncbi:M14 family metallocarboxypeptidase [Bacillus sp. CGMCC 1.16541]|uniref:M14 family metallopeptidase n=1 Tax=Bacillus sp. CGMCC 1.16541 TaxID=2185143 RepID=UPI000D7397A7|nr:M14 family metallocarboxypeptidase [Bacillus sp. CGMCC 1.16541]